MRKLVILALASTIIGTPAIARDGSAYVGFEGGAMRPIDTNLDFDSAPVSVNDGVKVDYGAGIDLDIVAGYDFGAVRAEAEFAYKRASVNDVRVNPDVFATPLNLDADGSGRVLSVMGNLLLDFGDDDGWSGYLGAGAGLARTKIRADLDGVGLGASTGFSGSDSGLAWQVVGGIRRPISDNVDLGLKYRFFNTRVSFDDEDVQGAPVELDGRFRSHSLLASLIFNFGGAEPAPPPPPPPPPAPPPPPPPPATQTCPDGSVTLASDVCPVPPPPPPPPPPAPERG